MNTKTSILASLLSCSLLVDGFCGFSQPRAAMANLVDPKILQTALELAEPLGGDYSYTYSGLTKGVAAKAIRDFKKIFKGDLGEKWYSLTDGYLVEFTHDSTKNVVMYDKKGNWSFTISYIDESRLAPSLKSLVESYYPGYNVTGAEEVSVSAFTFYVVHVQDKRTWKKLRIWDGEVDLIEDFNKE